MSSFESRRILLLWSDNTAANYGLRVLAAANAKLVCEAFSPEPVDVDCQDFGPGDSLVSFGTKSIFRNILSRKGSIDRKLAQYDLVVDTGAGDSFADIYGLKRLSFIVYAHYRIRRLKIPLIMAPQTVGPFNTKIGRYFARKSLSYASMVVTRDTASTRYCQDMGVTVDATATDVVFALGYVPPSQIEADLDVLLNVSGLLWFSDNHGDSRHYRSETIELIKSLIARNRSVVLLPHVINSRSGNDDIDASNALLDLLTAEGVNDVVIRASGSLPQARTLIASANVVIGARMHACLNALSLGVPAIPWAYSRKFGPLLADLGWDYVIDLKTETLPAQKTLRIVDALEIGTPPELERMRLVAAGKINDYVKSLAKTIRLHDNAR